MILGTAGRDVEALTRGLCRKSANPFVGRGDHAQENDMTLVPLECVGITANQAALFYDFRFQSFKNLVLDELGLRFSLKTDHAHSSACIARVIYAGDDLRQHGVGLRLIQRVLHATGAVTVSYVAENYRL